MKLERLTFKQKQERRLFNAKQVLAKAKAGRKEKNKHLFKSRAHVEMSEGEEEVYDYLKKTGVSFKREYSAMDLYNEETGYPLFLDFYIPAFKIAIEFDGGHHYQVMGKSEAALKRFADQLHRDSIKNEWCQKKGVEMIRIRHSDLRKLPEIFQGKFIKPKTKTTCT